MGKATYAEFQGTIGGNVVTIKTHFTGSANGVQAVSNNVAQTFYGPAGVTIGGAAASLTSARHLRARYPRPGHRQQNGAAPRAVVPEVALSDVFQTSRPSIHASRRYQHGGGGSFRLGASNGSHGITNMTPQLAQYLFTSGFIPLSQFSGLNADEGNVVIAGGRDPDSGTRLTAVAETGIGVTAVMIQYHADLGAARSRVTRSTRPRR